MLKTAAILLVTGGLVAAPVPASQEARPEAPAEARDAKPAAAPSSKKEEAKQRRERALFLLTGLADEAARFGDATLRARVQARAADTLWRVDRDRAVALFRRSWSSAESAYGEARRRHDEQMRKQRDEGGASVSFGFPDVREEVLRLVATRDRALGEELFAKLADSREREAEATDAPGQRGGADALREPSDAVAKRLRLAQDLLERDDVATALQFAEPALGAVSIPAVEFLTNLRDKDPSTADAWYGRLLGRAASDPAADANTVAVLAAYVFTPHTYVLVEPSGGRSAMTRGRSESPKEPSPESRAALLQVAAQVLTRPVPPEQLEATSAGRRGTLVQIGRMLPVFEQHAAHLVEPLRARQIALASESEEQLPEEPDMPGGPGGAPGGAERDPIAAALERARTAKTNEQRDAAYAQAALAAITKGDDRVGDFLNSIGDLTLRRDVRAHADFAAANRAVEARDVDRVLHAVRNGEIPNVQKVWALTAAAKLAAKDDKERAVSVLEEALAAARRIDLNDADRPRSIFAVATAFVDVDPSRVREYAAEAVQSANKAEGFTGEDGTLRVVLRMRGMVLANSQSAPGFDVAGVFAHLAQTDMEEATILAKNFEGEAPRATALLTVARTVLAGGSDRASGPSDARPSRPRR